MNNHKMNDNILELQIWVQKYFIFKGYNIDYNIYYAIKDKKCKLHRIILE